MNLKNENGMALVMTLLFTIILYVLVGIFVLTVVHESRMARIEREKAKSFYTAQGASQAALDQLDLLINNFLQNTIGSANPSGVINFTSNQVVAGDGIGWLVSAVRDNNVQVLTQNGEQAEFAQSSSLGGHNYNYNIIITEKTDPVAIGVEAWDFPFSYKIESTAGAGSVPAEVNISGDFTVRVQKDNFAKFALFTNSQTTPSGSNVWFTERTNFAGPVHTNSRFNFAFNPSGTFEDVISQEDRRARFYNEGFSILRDADFNGTRDVPTFNNGFHRDVSAISLSLSTQEQDLIDQAQGGQTISSDGIYVPNDGTSLTGGIYIKGNSSVNLSVDGSDRAFYTITEGSTTKTITVDRSNQTTIVENVTAGSSPQTYNGLPDGMEDVGTLIYVDGRIDTLSGVVQQDTQLTISSNDDIVITDNLVYSNYTPTVGTPGQSGYVPPSAYGTDNLLGLVTWQGNVRIGTSAPDHVQVHGTVMSENGIFTVDNYNDTGEGSRGTATVLGGVITNHYGAFGLFNSSTGQATAGYGRNFVYDQRMQAGESPPYFPTLNTFIAFTNDITDKMVWQEGE